MSSPPLNIMRIKNLSSVLYCVSTNILPLLLLGEIKIYRQCYYEKKVVHHCYNHSAMCQHYYCDYESKKYIITAIIKTLPPVVSLPLLLSFRKTRHDDCYYD